MSTETGPNRGYWLRVAAVLYFLSLIEWLRYLPILQYAVREETLPVLHAFGQTFHAMEGPLFQLAGLQAIIASIWAFGVLSALDLLAGYWLWKRHRRGTSLALVLLVGYWFFALGWAVPYMFLIGAGKGIALALGWNSAR